jgi:hypothetical protein
LAVANEFYSLSILFGDGTGFFNSGPTLPVGNSPISVVAGDVNGDGLLDLAVANQGDGTITVLLGDGLGGFGATTSFAVRTAPSWLAAGDLNGDRSLDLITANAGPANVSVLLNNCPAAPRR